MSPKTLSYRQMHEDYGFAMGSLYSLVCKRRIPHIRLGRRWVVFDRAKIEEWLQARQIAPRENTGIEKVIAAGARESER